MITNIARFFLPIVLLCGMQAVYACTCLVPGREKVFGDSDEVFVAEVLSVRLVASSPVATSEFLSPRSMGSYEATVRITKTLKGRSARSTKLVYSRLIDVVNCDLDIQAGDKLLVLRKRGQEVDVGLCSGRVIANPTSDDIGLLEKLAK